MTKWKLGFLFVTSLVLLLGCGTTNKTEMKSDVEVLSAAGIETEAGSANKENAADSKEDPSLEAEPSYQIDKDRTYIYRSEMEGGTRVTYTYLEPYQSAGLAWDMWLRQAGKDESTFLVMENEEGLYIGYPESEYYQVMSYPIMQDATFHSFEETFTTTKIDETITTPAGTFEHVVAVESPDHYISYYAPHIGTVKTVDAEGKTTFELIDIIH